MDRHTVSRRGFFGGMAAALATLGIRPDSLFAQSGAPAARGAAAAVGYDGLAKLANNENPWGPPQSVLKAMTDAMKYANRYGYPDGGIVSAIAEHHGLKNENVLLGAGSGEILQVVGATFLQDGKKVVGVDPTYASVYTYATGIKADAIKVPLLPDYRQDIPAIIRATKDNYRDVGFVYIVTPNNPTGVVVKKQEIQELLNNIPHDIPVLIDEAYHHFVEDPDYATSVPYITQGRQVIVARTFSKISGIAGMRLGYAVAPKELITRMRPNAVSSINALVKHGGVAALKDTAAQEQVKRETSRLRKKYAAELEALGYSVIPSETNFFMVHIRREIVPTIEEFRRRNVLVGRPFPPMTQHMRVSIGTEDEMQRFMVAFKEIFPGTRSTTVSSGR